MSAQKETSYVDKPCDIRILQDSIQLSMDNEIAVIYIHGKTHRKKTYDKKKYVSYGALILENGKITGRSFNISSNQQLAAYKEVGAELYAVNEILNYAKTLIGLKKKVVIHTNLKGLIYWDIGAWYCRNPYAIKFKELINEVRQSIDVDLIFVNSKSNNRYSHEVAELASAVLGKQLYVSRHGFDILDFEDKKPSHSSDFGDDYIPF